MCESVKRELSRNLEIVSKRESSITGAHRHRSRGTLGTGTPTPATAAGPAAGPAPALCPFHRKAPALLPLLHVPGAAPSADPAAAPAGAPPAAAPADVLGAASWHFRRCAPSPLRVIPFAWGGARGRKRASRPEGSAQGFAGTPSVLLLLCMPPILGHVCTSLGKVYTLLTVSDLPLAVARTALKPPSENVSLSGCVPVCPTMCLGECLTVCPIAPFGMYTISFRSVLRLPPLCVSL